MEIRTGSDTRDVLPVLLNGHYARCKITLFKKGDSMPAVSLVLPIFNIREEYLRKCLDSIRIQSFTDFEALLIDDGSKPYIRNLCEFYTEKDSRFHYFYQENAGVCAARNSGMDHSSGQYICFIDPDDWIERNYLESLYNRMEETDADIAIADCTVWYQNHHVQNRFLDGEKTVLKGEDKNLLLYQLVGKKICRYYPPEIACGVPWGKIYRKEFLEHNDLRFIPGMKRMEDNIFNLYAFEHAKAIAYEPSYLYCYRKEEGSASYRYDPDLISHFEKYFEETRKFLDLFHKEEILYKALAMKELTSFNSFLNYYYYRLENHTSREIRRMINDQLEREPYKTALSEIDPQYLTKQEYIFVTALKYRYYSLLKLLIKARSAIRK